METVFHGDALHVIHGTVTTSMLSSFYSKLLSKLLSKSSVQHSLTALHTQQRLERVGLASEKIDITFTPVRSLVPAHHESISLSFGNHGKVFQLHILSLCFKYY